VTTTAATSSKAERALPLAAEMEKGKVDVVRGPWNEPLFDEMEAFSADPQHSGAHDDQVDACSGGFAKVRQAIGGGIAAARPRGDVHR
jgi:predicted phage terminase large subunit-like protein